MFQPIIQVDAFTTEPFTGNPAGVCILSEPANEDWMQKVAREMNLSETAFLHPERDGYNLRWFTPAAEVDLCGHATLASAHVLWEEAHIPPDKMAYFYTKSGVLTARRQGDWIELDFPSEPDTAVARPDKLLEALGVMPRYVGQNRLDYLVQLDTEEMVRAVRPDFNRLLAVSTRGVIVTSRADSPGYDFVSRFFAPAVGINEDPVTGSAHTCLGPFWGRRLNKEKLVGYQASARGGVVRVRLGGPRVYLGGQAVTVLRGTLV